jgi:hypothetical protein
MNREQILAEIKRLADANAHTAIGERAFFAQTMLNRTVLRRAGFPNYGAAVEAAGYQRNELKQRYDDDTLFAPIARLARELGHCPTYGERAVERYKDSTFPGEASISRRTKVEPLVHGLVSWCRNQPEYHDVARLLDTAAGVATRVNDGARNRNIVTGYVYLMRYGAHGKDFKLGHSENVQRRQAQIDMVSPHDVRVVHTIETDDPEGIEKYWQQRFSARRVKTKEVFRLTADDIAAFKRRKYQ